MLKQESSYIYNQPPFINSQKNNLEYGCQLTNIYYIIVQTLQKMSNKGQNKEFHQKLSKNSLKSIIWHIDL